MVRGGGERRHRLVRNKSPRRGRRGRKIAPNGTWSNKVPKKTMISGGTLSGSSRRALVLKEFLQRNRLRPARPPLHRQPDAATMIVRARNALTLATLQASRMVS